MNYLEKLISLPFVITSNTTTHIIPAPTDGRYIAIDFIHLYINGSGTFSMQDTALTPIVKIPTFTVVAQQGFIYENSSGNQDGVFSTLPNQGIDVVTLAGCQISGFVNYRLIGN